MKRSRDGRLAVSVCAVVRNEEALLGTALEAWRGLASEVLICDQESTDRTCEVAARHADMVWRRPPVGLADVDRDWLYGQATQPWIFACDPDEFPSEEFFRHLPELLESRFDVIWLRREDWVDGRKLDILGDDWQPRLFRRGAVHYSGRPHEYPEIASPNVCWVDDAPIRHTRSLERIRGANAARDAYGPEIQQRQRGYIEQVERALGVK